MEFLNLSKLYEWAKVHRYAVKTGKFKDTGAEYKELSPEERALLQGMVDDVLGQFKAAVASGRKLNPEQVAAIADGRIFSGSQAKAAHLVDELGTLQDAVNDAAKQAQIKGKPKVVYPDKQGKNTLFDLLFDSGSRDDESAESSLSGGAGSAGSLISRIAKLILGGEGAESVDPIPAPGIYWIWKGAR
jgi:protease-4